MTKDIFIDKVSGKSLLEVLDAAGGPDIIEKPFEGEYKWIYEDCATDTDQGKDVSLAVTIKNGICVRVEDFELSTKGS